MQAQPLTPGRLHLGEDLAVLVGAYHGAIEAEPLRRVRVDLAGEGGGAETTSRLKQAIPTSRPGNICSGRYHAGLARVSPPDHPASA